MTGSCDHSQGEQLYALSLAQRAFCEALSSYEQPPPCGVFDACPSALWSPLTPEPASRERDWARRSSEIAVRANEDVLRRDRKRCMRIFQIRPAIQRTLPRLSLVPVTVLIASCAFFGSRHTIEFSPLKRADRLVVLTRSGDIVKTVTDPAQVSAAAQFIQAYRSGWQDPLEGIVVPEFVLHFYAGTSGLGGYGIGAGYVTSDPPTAGFWSRPAVPTEKSIWHAQHGLNGVDHRLVLGPWGDRRHYSNAEHCPSVFDLAEHATAVPSAAAVPQKRRALEPSLRR